MKPVFAIVLCWCWIFVCFNQSGFQYLENPTRSASVSADQLPFHRESGAKFEVNLDEALRANLFESILGYSLPKNGSKEFYGTLSRASGEFIESYIFLRNRVLRI